MHQFSIHRPSGEHLGFLVMLADDEIISLRTHVRKAAESKLAHGIIDTHGLMQEINNENAARIRQAIHEMDMLREMYNLKYTNNE